jgi:fructoselysine-6-P-deglycase FrlB-like protein
MTYVDGEIASQPECWEAAIVAAERHAQALPMRGEHVAIVGCGTSYNIALAYAALREHAGHGLTDALPASEMLQRPYDRVILLSRSGTTTEVLRAIEALPDGQRTVAITADPDAPIVPAVDHSVVLDGADERSVVQTRFATAALAMLRAQLGEPVARLIEPARVAAAAPVSDAALRHGRFVFLGSGWSVGIAHEAALKLREAACAWTESYPAMEFRHGPISASDGDTLVWSLVPPPAGLAQALAPSGATLVDPGGDPMVQLIEIQRLAVALARARGLDPDHPRYLTRSVILSA